MQKNVLWRQRYMYLIASTSSYMLKSYTGYPSGHITTKTKNITTTYRQFPYFGFYFEYLFLDQIPATPKIANICDTHLKGGSSEEQR